MTEKIYFNGKVYRNRSEMPSDVRAAYDRLNQFFVDNDQDGIPDSIQGKGISGLKDVFGMIKEISKSAQSGQQAAVDQFTVVRKTGNKIIVNGKEFSHPDEMPDDIKKAYERIVTEPGFREVGIYDEPWRETRREDYFKPHDDEVINQPYVTTPAIEDVTNNSNLFILSIAGIVVICVGATVWFILSGSLPGF